ncbi:MAG: L-lactate permease [Alphaproteobacteria bacterium]|jgi:lactate permease|nr:L-lactate permease [Alphaproteobacteria bacterium]
MLYALLASFPIVFCLLSMSILKWKGVVSISVSLLISIILAIFVWQLKFIDIIQYAINGILEVSNIILIIFGAILLLNILIKSGAMDIINNSFNNISEDSRIHLLLIGLAFNTFLNGIAAFGTEVVLSSLVLISLGFPSFPAAIVSLAFNAPFITFGAVGIPTITAITLTQSLAQEAGLDVVQYANLVATYSAFLHSIAGMFLTVIILFLVIKIFAKEKSWKPFFEIIPFALLNSAIMYASYYFSAKYLGPDLPTVIAGIVGLISVIFTTKLKILLPKTVWKFPANAKIWDLDKNIQHKKTVAPTIQKNLGKLKVWLPYIIVSAILILSRIKGLWLQDFFKSRVLHIEHLFGLEKVNYDFLWLYSPGIMPFLFVSLIFIVVFHLSSKDIKSVFIDTWHQAKLAALAIVLSVMMVSIMLKSTNNPLGLQGMLVSIAGLISYLKGVGVIIITPFIGALGTFISGSNTTSNILFSITSFNTASIINIPPYILVALSSVGGGAGIMFAFKNLLIVASVIGLKNKEGHMLNYMLLISIVYILIILGVVFITI